MKKFKWLAVVLALVLVLTMVVGCGKKEAPAPEPAPAEGPAEVKVGVNLELSGNVAIFGESVANAMEMAFEEYNAKGEGPTLTIVKYDNKSDSGEALNVATKLIAQDQVSIVVGPVISTNVLATVPVGQEYGVPILTPTGTATAVTVPAEGQLNDFIFRSCFIDPFQGKVAAKFAAENLGLKTAAIFVDNNSDYSKGLRESFTAAFEAAGGTIVAVEGFVTEDQDFRATLTKIKGANPEIIFVPAYYEQVGKIVQQAREVGFAGAMMGADGWDSPKLLEIAGAESLQNTYFTNHYSPEDTDPLVVNFVTAYTERYGNVPDALAALGYDAAKVVIGAVTTANSADPVVLRDTMRTMQITGVTGNISFDEFHNPVKAAVVIGFTPEGAQTFVAKVEP